MTLAGNGTDGYVDSTVGTQASFGALGSLALLGTDQLLVLSLSVRKILLSSTSYPVTPWAGTATWSYANGPQATAKFNAPTDLDVDSAGAVYVADMGNHRIRLIKGGQVTDFAGSGPTQASDGGPGTGSTVDSTQPLTARFASPFGLTLSTSGRLYVAEYGGHVIRLIEPSGKVTTIAGDKTAGYLDGPGPTARFDRPTRMALDASAGVLYVADAGNGQVRALSLPWVP